ncbi:MAG: tRNA 2-thiouridine(34) synthase MnmA, partial [Candidatus Moranbacteria bacterium]|nr:tRNA 2-thiouridine(34) synthase MnmA [Candidatus Moranbacteria bacterium]
MKIAMLISGGVDSSVSLRLLQEQGHDITAFYLKIWLEDEMSFLGECPWEDDLSYATQVCREADVPLEVVPFQKEYWERIVSYTIDEVKRGHTPNPDVLCNTRVKFGAFYEYLMSRDETIPFEKIASGHYAQTEMIDGVAYLKRSPDETKDQTYFLSQLSQPQVAMALFPIGGLQKPAVRALAEKFKLPNAKRKDSQGLCFLGKIRFDAFVKFHLGTKIGDMIDCETKEKMGEHEGFWYYTIGQRKGIGLSGGPWYVVDKDIEKNIVYISNSYRSEETARSAFEVNGLNWISENPLQVPRLMDKKLQVKVRHGATMYPCEIEPVGDEKLKVRIDGYD